MGQLQTKKIYIHQLQPGMYVCGLDRPWLETPFSVQGFMIHSSGDIQKLSLYCDYAYVDPQRSVTAINFEASKKSPLDRSGNKPGQAAIPFQQELSSRQLRRYDEQLPVTQEIRTAQTVYRKIKGEFDRMAERILRGREINITRIQQVGTPMVESIIRNPGASIWLARLKSKSSYNYSHCIAVAIWCTVIGRQIGLPTRELMMLFTGGMLLDIGKLKIPDVLLNKRSQLSEREFTLVSKHVELSLKLVNDSQRQLPQSVVEMIASHHERFNGSGYPQSLQGTEIPLYGRIAAVADCYDAITSQRVHAKPLPHALAIKKLYEWRGYDFQPELIEVFIQSLGIYPTGTLVELSSGEAGIVIKENPGKRLRPRVLVILDRNKQQLEDFREIDLANFIGEDRRVVEILKTLEPGAYGLNPETLYI